MLKRVSCAGAVLALALASVPVGAQEAVYGGQERQFGGLWSDWPNGYVASTLSATGQPLLPIFEGWYVNEDGTHDLSFSYLNMNLEQTFHIPIGQNNYLEPAEFNGMQPTFFMPAPERGREGEQRHYRHQATFTVTLPAGFDPDQDVVWTLRYDGKTVKVPGRIRVGSYRVENLEAFTSAPLNEEPHTVFWFDHQGPAAVSFQPQQLEVPGAGGNATVRATFSEPGEYMVRATAVQTLASMVQHCCYTNGYLKVTVTP